tara:strand:+ start:830 stop:1045 length:216 start_codon:yes stop_codon:yes gene_type:complete
MRHISAIVSKRIEVNKHFAWIPVRLDNGNLTWLQYYYEEVFYYALGHDFRRLESHLYNKDEYILRKLSGVK